MLVEVVKALSRPVDGERIGIQNPKNFTLIREQRSALDSKQATSLTY